MVGFRKDVVAPHIACVERDRLRVFAPLAGAASTTPGKVGEVDAATGAVVWACCAQFGEQFEGVATDTPTTPFTAAPCSPLPGAPTRCPIHANQGKRCPNHKSVHFRKLAPAVPTHCPLID